MKYLFFDTETHLIKPGMTAPRLVCEASIYVDDQPNVKPIVNLVERDKALAGMPINLDPPSSYKDLHLVGHNVFYDRCELVSVPPDLPMRRYFLRASEGEEAEVEQH